MKYLIRYTDGAYEFTQGSGFPCSIEEARRFDSKEDAEEHSLILIGVATIEEIEE